VCVCVCVVGREGVSVREILREKKVPEVMGLASSFMIGLAAVASLTNSSLSLVSMYDGKMVSSVSES